MNNKILVIATHPDDETLGCGGTLLKHKANGDEIHWLIATDIKESDGFELEQIMERDIEIKAVEKFFGFNSINRLGLSTTRVDEYSASELINRISTIINKIKANIVYLPYKYDIHSDHGHIFDAAYSCTKSFRYPFIKKVYMMEVLSETEFSVNIQGSGFVPNVFVDVSDYINQKIEAIKIYKSEIGEHPFPRSERNVRALATFRGATCGCEYAESFILIKEIN
jgi:N-acetylglucosamine malate deacetylase 1